MLLSYIKMALRTIRKNVSSTLITLKVRGAGGTRLASAKYLAPRRLTLPKCSPGSSRGPC